MHPLDPLDQLEVSIASQACMEHARTLGLPPLRFNTVTLEEPDKAVMVPFLRGKGPRPDRVALVVLIIPRLNAAAEALVDVTQRKVVGWKMLDGVQPLTNPDDNASVEVIAKSDPRVVQLIKERYEMEDMSKVIVDPWSVHGPPEHLKHKRLMQGFFFLKLSPNDNEYAHPMDLTVIVDLNEEKVVQLDLYPEPPPVPMHLHNYHRELLTCGWREGPKPLDIVQPQGPSFTVQGQRVQWQNWDFRVGFNPREGMVLHQVSYLDREQGRLRPVLYRASLVEMCVPYGAPDFPYTRKCAFDLGDYGYGFSTNSLELGCDCLGVIKYFDAVVNDATGAPVTIKNAICMHEEDAGLLWKHYDFRSCEAEVRRSRRLVLSTIATFMNYEYATYWYFYQDGSMQYEVKLTGVLSTHPVPKGLTKSEYGSLVAEGCDAAYHQHLFCVRMDPAVDDEDNWGKGLVVSEVDAELVPHSPGNRHGNAFRPKETDLLSTQQAQRDQAPEVARSWKIRNPEVLNPVCASPVAYKLFPTACAPLLAQPDSLVSQRGLFTRHSLFVTPYHQQQCFPAGMHVVQSDRDMGLGEWMKQDQSLVHSDPVLWYSFSATHFPRCEDWPVMPVEALGFHLRPYNFFKHNPALDLPPDRSQASKGVSCAAVSKL